MKKIMIIIVCVICLLTMVFMFGCDNKDKGENDIIIGNWIGREDGEDFTRNFYAEIVFLRSEQGVTPSGDKRTLQIFQIEVKVISKSRDTELLTVGELRELRLDNQYGYEGDFSPLPHGTTSRKYYYRFELDDSNNITVTERDEFHTDKLTGRTCVFEKTDLTLEEYEEQIKAQK